nr:heat stress transcription factor A-4c-like [Tanacetum cinerariifolium]
MFFTKIGKDIWTTKTIINRRDVVKQDQLSNGQTRSVPKEPSRSVPEEPTRSVPKEPSRSVLKEPTRLVPKEPSRSVPRELSRSVLKEPTRSVPREPSRLVLKEPTRSVPREPSRSVLKETTKSVHLACLIERAVRDFSLSIGIFVREKISRDVITVGSTMRIPLLYRGKYLQWRERFMNYLEEKTDGEVMINSIQNGEQDRKAAIVYEYETFKAIEGEQLLDTYLRYLQVINDLKKCGYKKDNCELNYKFLNNLQPKWKQYGDVNDALGYKKKAVVITSDPLALVAEKKNVSKQKEKVVVSSDSKESGADDFSELKKITALTSRGNLSAGSGNTSSVSFLIPTAVFG